MLAQPNKMTALNLQPHSSIETPDNPLALIIPTSQGLEHEFERYFFKVTGIASSRAEFNTLRIISPWYFCNRIKNIINPIQL